MKRRGKETKAGAQDQLQPLCLMTKTIGRTLDEAEAQADRDLEACLRREYPILKLLQELYSTSLAPTNFSKPADRES